MRPLGGRDTDACRTGPERLEEKEFTGCCLEPWDILRGKDVFTMHGALCKDFHTASHTHFAPNCATFSRARERPIPGVDSPPPPLRSTEHPEGLEWVFAKGGSLARKVTLDTRMADLSAQTCWDFAQEGKTFTLEHPDGSIARQLKSWQKLEKAPGVKVTRYHACMFNPCKRRKRQVLIHNVPGLEEFIARVCMNERCCTRTGACHLSWKPSVENGRVLSFRTGEEREYPEEFCGSLARGISSYYSKKGNALNFLEVFSGPNAPLTVAVAECLGVPNPKPFEQSKGEKGITTEFRTLGDLSSGLTHLNSPEFHCREDGEYHQPLVESNSYRLAAVEAGRQPSYGKRNPLIPDGFNCPGRHFRTAKGLKHPFQEEQVIKDDHRIALNSLRSKGFSISEWRLKQLARIKSLVDSSKYRQAKENESSSWTCKKLGAKAQTVAMKVLQEQFGIEDRFVPEACLRGLPIVGKASCSPFFEPFEVPPQISEKEFYEAMSRRNEDLIERVGFMGKKGGLQLADAIFKKTQKEVAAGTMGPPHDQAFYHKKYKGVFNVVPSFGLEQGVDESGQPKYRRIDDHSAAANNLVAHRLQKVPMTMVDYVAALIKFLYSGLNCRLSLATEDMKSAYRQVALLPEHVRFAITAVYNPSSDSVELYEMYGQPFGAGHAVPNFCRIAEWIGRLLTRCFHIAVDHFFDDFFVVEPTSTIQVAIFCIRETFKALGFTLDAEKSQQPSEVVAILGVLFNTASLKDQRSLCVEAKESRVRNLIISIDSVLSKGFLTQTLCASIVGKFNFLCSTLFGKVGRCCTTTLRKIQYGNHATVMVTTPLRRSLKLMKFLLTTSPSRRLRVIDESPILLYTDASDVPGRSPQQVLGAFLFNPVSSSLSYTSCEVSAELVSSWLPRKSYMGQLELLATVLALSTWSRTLQERHVILFVDNDSAASGLVKGYSPQLDSGAIIGQFWLSVAEQKLSVYIDRVESKSNPSDGPSRLDYTLMHEWGASWTTPNFDLLVSPKIHPDHWFGTAND